MLNKIDFEYTFQEEDFICGNRFIEISNLENIIFCKTDYIQEYQNKNISTFITHNSDYHIDKKVVDLGPKHQRWFCQNKDLVSEKLISLPIGLENFEPVFGPESSYGKYSTLPRDGFYKKEYIQGLISQNRAHDKLLYLNFNPTTYPSERNQVLKIFSNFQWVTKRSNISWQNYYDDIAEHKFILSPRGNGVDCHRTWESLYLKSIPIVKRSIHMNEFSDLPILFIDSWEEITEEFLLTEYDRMVNQDYNFDKLKISYWKDIINATAT